MSGLQGPIDFVEDTTFCAQLPCQECRAEAVPYCLDYDRRTIGACEQHLGELLRRLVVELGREVFVIPNVAVPPLADPHRQNVEGL
jgi:hypothetical protein